jgi:hypothetical protein
MASAILKKLMPTKFIIDKLPLSIASTPQLYCPVLPV